ncbi:MAG TPA: hypothetical protein VFW13_07630 [Phenylobacterium sp.]|nr:hypothetical protein [Phenylobacterium sp.]
MGRILEIGRPASPVGAAAASVRLIPDGAVNPLDLAVPRPEDEARLSHAGRGDRVWLTVDDPLSPKHAVAVARVARPTTVTARLVTLLAALALGIAVAAVAARWRPQRFLVGSDNRYSNSQCQLVLWFGALAVIYASTCALRIWALGLDFIGGVNIPTNLLVLTGLSALTFGGAKIVATQKQDSANQAAAAVGVAGIAPAIKTNALQPVWRDLVTTDMGHADFGDFQMMLVAVSAVVIFVLSAFHFLGALDVSATTVLPDVDTTLLGAFGVGQGAYLIKKAALPIGQG